MLVKKKRRKILKKASKKKTLKKRVIKKVAARRKVAKRARIKKGITKTKALRGSRKKENIIGKITHYFPKVRAAVVKLDKPLAVGDVVKIKGHTTDFQQAVTSMQVDRVSISQAKKGQEIGLLVDSRVRQHDTVYKG